MNTYLVKGSRSSDSDFVNSNKVTLKAWDLTAFGPWRYKSTGTKFATNWFFEDCIFIQTGQQFGCLSFRNSYLEGPDKIRINYNTPLDAISDVAIVSLWIEPWFGNSFTTE